MNQPSPLADRMRPRRLEEFCGQSHILAPGKPLYEAIRAGRPHSTILWGPPGTGKTTLAQLIANQCDADFIKLSAVLSGVKEIRAAVDRAQANRRDFARGSLLFVDEVHRFNKAQQDAFLPHIENGTFIFIGATTENPAFELNNALLSRARTHVLKSLEENDIQAILRAALEDADRGLGEAELVVDESALILLSSAADGDARRALNLLELAAELAADGKLDETSVKAVLGGNLRRFDKGGDAFYDQISALHKSVRGSAPDAALYWYARMLDGGCDPLYIARRVVRMASEDIGNADPRALEIALNAWDVQSRLGSPEGELAIAQAIVYLAAAAKSNAVYMAFKAAQRAATEHGSLEVPNHLRNAPTNLAKSLGHGKFYRYAHDEPEAYAAGEEYFPESMVGTSFYFPVDRGLELKIRDKLEHLQNLDRDWKSRYSSAE